MYNNIVLSNSQTPDELILLFLQKHQRVAPFAIDDISTTCAMPLHQVEETLSNHAHSVDWVFI